MGGVGGEEMGEGEGMDEGDGREGEGRGKREEEGRGLGGLYEEVDGREGSEEGRGGVLFYLISARVSLTSSAKFPLVLLLASLSELPAGITTFYYFSASA